MRKHLSIVVPVRNENEFLRPFYYDLLRQNLDYSFELIWVNNASTDSTFEEIQELMEQDPVIRCITLKHEAATRAAVIAGLDFAEGDYIIVMKGDLQHPRHLIASIVQSLEDGAAIVNLKPGNKNESNKIQRWCFDRFYSLERKLRTSSPVTDISDFRGFRREVVNDILFTNKNHFFVEQFFNWKEYSIQEMVYENKRCPGHFYKYSFSHLRYSYYQALRQLEPGRLRKFALMGLSLSIFSVMISGSMIYCTYAGLLPLPPAAYIIPLLLFLVGMQLYILSSFHRKIKEDLYYCSRDMHYVIEHIYEQSIENELEASDIQREMKALRKVS